MHNHAFLNSKQASYCSCLGIHATLEAVAAQSRFMPSLIIWYHFDTSACIRGECVNVAAALTATLWRAE
jgi:hypothetical protein